MLARFCFAWFAVLATAGLSYGQAPATPLGNSAASPQWRTSTDQGTAAKSAAGETSLAPNSGNSGQPITRVTPGTAMLPNQSGQVWRQYDITPYTSRVTTTTKPEQAIIDWILRETGTEVWFSEPLGLLNANSRTLTVYHTPEMQRMVAEIVDRFVGSEAESHVLGLRLLTVGSPNWRSRALALMRPVNVQTPGVDAWLLTKENAAVLVAEMSKRTDYREYGSPSLLIQNGQSHTISRMRPHPFVHSVQLRENAYPNHELEMGQVDEGFSLQLSPLMSLDQRTIDAVIKCQVEQLEKFVPVPIDLPAPPGQQRQRVQIQVPQTAGWRLHERFRWPADHVLLISCGVGAAPGPEQPTTFGVPNPFSGAPPRSDALLFIESKGKASQALLEAQREPANNSTPNYRGRY
jgi:hypothetical protein